MKRGFLVATVAAFLFPLTGDRLGAQVPDDLKFFRNFFVTGDYYTAGVGLKDLGVGGFSTDAIAVAEKTAEVNGVPNGVPRGADILAAYLYWQVVSDTGPEAGALGVKFKPQGAPAAYDLSLPDDLTTTGVVDPKPFGKILASAGTAACFNPGGGTGDNGSSRRTYTYRMDVLRFFEVEGPGTPSAPNPFAGKTAIIGNHEVSVPDVGGGGNQTPIALGASLMFVYRDPTKPLSAIVVYDDGVTLGNAQRTLTQPIAGFYQPAAVPNASISYIVGSGDPAKNEAISYPGGSVMNPFSGSSSPAWDNLTYAVNLGSNPSGVSQITTTITNDIGQRDCLSVAAIVFKTAVLDDDNDGLLNAWETATTPLSDPNGKPLPLLSKMGAKVDQKDIFIEIGYMNVAAQVDSPPETGPWCGWTACPDNDTVKDSVSYGGELRPPHSHRPGHEVLKLAGDTFKSNGIRVHFDVGTSYPACTSGPCANEYIIGRRSEDNPTLAPPRGGESLDEMATAGDVPGDTLLGCVRAATDPPWVCQFKDFPGTVGWKTGYRFIRDAVTLVNGATPPVNYNEDLCGTAGNNCTFRFDPNRRDTFRYAFFAHALGIPKSPDTESPDFHVPVTNTGIADWRGGDTLLTLGAFLDHDNVSPVGTPFQQASTLVHELGHQMGRRHNGDTLAPNCTPQYLSSMNYLYQLRGLIGPDGIPRIGLSNNAQGAVFDEDNLADGASGVNSTFRLSWYAPVAGPLAAKPGVTPAKRHCDGSLITNGAQYVRVDTGNLGAVDWNGDGSLQIPAPDQDLNFDGFLDTGAFSLRGSTDWSKLELNQIGSRRSPGGYFFINNDDGTVDIGVGPLSLGSGKGDLGTGDISEYALGSGKGDLGGGKGDLGVGKGDLGGGKGDLGGGKGDLGVGKGDLGGGKGDLGSGKGDLGLGDGGGGDLFGDEGEMDETLASDLTRVPPNQVTAVRLASPQNYVQLSWLAPNNGGLLRYTAYRALIINDVTLQTGPWEKLLTPGQLGTVEVPAGIGLVNRNFTWVDPDSHRLITGRKYAYQVTATYRVKDSVTGLYSELESNGSSPDAIVTMANASPLIAHAIAAQTIRRNESTVPLSFTVTDTESDNPIGSIPKLLLVSASVTAASPAILASQISFTFNIPNPLTPSARTVTVKHTGTEKGTVTIRLQVQDTQCSHAFPPTGCTPGTTNATTFNLTVKQ
jgi:hypothetical protein